MFKLVHRKASIWLATSLAVIGWNVHSLNPATCISRRVAISTASIASMSITNQAPLAWSDEMLANDAELGSQADFKFEQRDRKKNKDVIIREDYWYMTGRLPPRKLEVSLRIDDPQWNAFGSCETTGSSEGGSNSCTYVSLKQRIPAYSKYGYAISDGAKEFQKLGSILERLTTSETASETWDEAASFVTAEDRTIPPAVIDAELKMVLLATLLLTSPNFPTPGRELLVARFYVNEVHFATQSIATAVQARNARRAFEAWKFGRDSWNSYFQVVNKSITPKVGEQFSKIL